MRLSSFLYSCLGLFCRPFFYVLVLFVSANTYSKTLIFQSDSNVAQAQRSTVQEPAPASRNYSTSPRVSNTNVSNTIASNTSVSNAANGELFFVIEQLKQDVRNLRGLLEEQSFRLQQLEKNSKSRYRDIDARVLRLSKDLVRNASTVVSPVSSGTSSVDMVTGTMPSKAVPNAREAQPVSDEQKLAYRDAYQLVKDKQFERAVDALHAYIEKYPEGELTGNAYYWLGEVYLVLPQLKQAQQSFNIVVKTFPGHRKVADAMFKLAVAYDRLQDPANSEKYLKKVQQQFPSSTASKLAKSYKITQ